MLKAKKQDDSIIYAFDIDEKPIEQLRCPECSSDVIFKNGKIKVSHFAHRTLTDCAYGVGESQDHMFMKKHFYLRVRNKYPGLNMTLEDNSFTDRRADISIRGNEKSIVIELQRSPITVEEILQRTLDYNKQGMYVMWIFHISRIKSQQFYEKGKKRIPNELLQMEKWGLLHIMCSEKAEIRKVKFVGGGDTKTMRVCCWENDTKLDFKFDDEIFVYQNEQYYLQVATLDHDILENPNYELYKEKRKLERLKRVGENPWSW